MVLNDPGNICAETNGSSHVSSGNIVSLQCDVDNTGAIGGNYLIWIVPVSKIKCVIILFLVLRLFFGLCIFVCGYVHLTLLYVMFEIDE